MSGKHYYQENNLHYSFSFLPDRIHVEMEDRNPQKKVVSYLGFSAPIKDKVIEWSWATDVATPEFRKLAQRYLDNIGFE